MNPQSLPFRLDTLRQAFLNGMKPRTVFLEFLARLAHWNDPALFISVAQAEQLEPLFLRLDEIGPEKLPLYGIPFAIKDNIDWNILPTTAACPAFSYQPKRSATVIERLIAAGAVPVGKTNMDQFATGLVGTRSPYGTPRNARGPWIPGGSSSGSASAVAAGLVAFSLGTDTAGSGRVPAGFQGLVGYKPTRGWLSTRGVVPACRSLDCISVFTTSASHAKEIFSVLFAYDKEDPWSRRPVFSYTSLAQELVLGIPRQDQREFSGDADYCQAYSSLLEKAKARGLRLKEVDFTLFKQVAKELYEGPWLAERRLAVKDLWPNPKALHPITRQALEYQKDLKVEGVFESQHRLEAAKREVEQLWHDIDALLVPTAPTLPTAHDVDLDPMRVNSHLGYYTNFANLLDLSALALPESLTKDGKPFGFTVLGPQGADLKLFAFGEWWEKNLKPAWGPTVIAVAGAHLRGLSLNGQLLERGARFLTEARTSPQYRLYVIGEGQGSKPGLVRVAQPDEGGRALDLELWDLPQAHWGSFLSLIPYPLGLGKVELEDGQWVTGFLMSSGYSGSAPEITNYGGWRNYLNSLSGDRSRH